jgi:hypothetical protein
MRRSVLCVSIGLGTLAAVAQVAAAARERENLFLTGQYACGNQGLQVEELADCGVTILSHDTWVEDMAAMRARVRRAHELGMRVLAYVSRRRPGTTSSRRACRRTRVGPSPTTLPSRPRGTESG